MSGGQLGHRTATGALTASNPYLAGGWSVLFRADDMSYPGDVEIYHIALLGPGGGFLVYIDDNFYSASDRGDINEYDPTWPMFVRRGQSVSFHWNISSGSAPNVWIYAREPGLNL